jgi:phage-related protein
MPVFFEVEFLADARLFLDSLDEKTQEKIYLNICKSKRKVDKKLFKKINETIWEFRTLFNGNAYRLFAFWDVGDSNSRRLVVATHGIQKSTSKIPKRELHRAEQIRKRYLERRSKEN